MTQAQQFSQYPPAEPPRKPRWSTKRKVWTLTGAGFAGLVALIAVAGAIGSSHHPAPAPTSSIVPAPKHDVAGQIANTAPAPAASPPFTPVTLLKFSGSGTEVTPSFTATGNGDYIVYWTFAGNDSSGIGGDNFIMNEDGGRDFNALGLPNDIQASGSGSTEVTDDAGMHTFNVQADQTADWTVKVVSAQ